MNNAFLHDNLTEDVYMQQPPDFIDPFLPTHVCRLKKAIKGSNKLLKHGIKLLTYLLLSMVLFNQGPILLYSFILKVALLHIFLSM